MAHYVRIFVLFAGLLCGGISLASPCYKIDPPEIAFEKATVVFSGIVVDKIDHPRDVQTWPHTRISEYVFRVGQVWKGPLEGEFRVFVDGPWRDRLFRGATQYLVYCSVDDERGEMLVHEVCMRRKLIDRALVDLVVLRDSYVVDPSLAVDRPTEAELVELCEKHKNRIVGIAAKEALGRLADKRKETGAEK